MAFKLLIDGAAHEVEIVGRRPHLTVRVDGRLHVVSGPGGASEGRHEITVDGHGTAVVRAHGRGRQAVRIAGRTFESALLDPRAAAEAAGGGQDAIKAPMPGAVVSVHKTIGETVQRGETIVTIESMKLQTALASPRDGVVAALLKREGDTFEKDEVIARLEETSGIV